MLTCVRYLGGEVLLYSVSDCFRFIMLQGFISAYHFLMIKNRYEKDKA